MMLVAVARAYAVLGDDAYRTAAEKEPGFSASQALGCQHQDALSPLARRERDSVQLLDAYAKLLAGVIELYEATLDAKHLEFALALAESMMARFYDAEKGGFWQSAAQAPDLILRFKEDYDGAEPSGNRRGDPGFAQVKRHHGPRRHEEGSRAKPASVCPTFADVAASRSPAFAGLGLWAGRTEASRSGGGCGVAAGRQLLRAAHSVYQPNKVVLGNTGPVEAFAKTLPLDKGSPVVYLCTA